MVHGRRHACLGASLLALLVSCGGDNGPRADLAQTASPPTAPSCTLTMGWNPWEPYHYLDIGGVVRGVDVELVGAVADACGCALSLVRADFSTLLSKLETGNWKLAK